MEQVLVAKGKAKQVFKQIKLMAEKRGDVELGSLVRQSLKVQGECPKCGVSWRAVEDMLHDGINSDNYQTALVITANCDICRMRFSEELKRLR